MIRLGLFLIVARMAACFQVKSEIRATFGSQLSQMRRREQQLLETLDTVASVKDGILSEQQDQLHQALGTCLTVLQLRESFMTVSRFRRMRARIGMVPDGCGRHEGESLIIDRYG